MDQWEKNRQRIAKVGGGGLRPGDKVTVVEIEMPGHPHCSCCGVEMLPQYHGLVTRLGNFCHGCASDLVDHLLDKSPWRGVIAASVRHFKVWQKRRAEKGELE